MGKGEIQQRVDNVFSGAFGRTPLALRLQDILGEALELSRHTDLRNLREEAGDLAASLLALMNECGWTIEELVGETLEKIERRRKQYSALGRKVKVALLGGAFDPPHVGHIEIAKLVLDVTGTFDEVWLVPCFKHMFGKDTASAEHRLQMCERAVACDGRIKVCNYEIKHELSGETFKFVTQLLEEPFAQDEYDFSYIIGQDNANNFSNWVNYEHLERLIRFVVVPRQGVQPDPAVTWYRNQPHIVIGPERPTTEISSTDLRKIVPDCFTRYQHGQGWSEAEQYVDPAVLEYIREHGLYQSYQQET